jgi:hypothetical protein
MWERHDYPFVWLLFHAELLIFSPSPNQDESINECTRRRLQLLYAGHIASLWSEVLQVTSRPPGSAPPSPTSTNSVNKAAQAAADCDNFRTAYARATTVTPVATVSPTTLNDHVKPLYPPSLPPLHPHQAPPTRSTTNPASPTSPFFTLRGNIIHTIRQAPRGKANGFVMDSMDIFVTLAKSQSDEVHSQLTSFFTRIYNGEVHDLIVPYLTSTYLFCLHKDLDDPTKLQPIGVPTAIRRILASHVAKTFRNTFARHLLPYNYAIGVPNGMDFVVKATQLQVDRFITQPQLRGDSPSRCLVSLDLKNMFNEISREKIFEIITAHFPELLPLTSMLYNETGEVWLRMADGSCATIDMVEGTNQGCPLSSTLAAIVLHSVIAPIADLLQQRAASRLAQGNPGDDGFGGVSIPMG